MTNKGNSSGRKGGGPRQWHESRRGRRRRKQRYSDAKDSGDQHVRNGVDLGYVYWNKSASIFAEISADRFVSSVGGVRARH